MKYILYKDFESLCFIPETNKSTVLQLKKKVSDEGPEVQVEPRPVFHSVIVRCPLLPPRGPLA